MLTSATGLLEPQFLDMMVAQGAGGEPTILADTSTSPWGVLITEPGFVGGSHLWVSSNGARSFVRAPDTDQEGGDSDISTAPGGVLYVSEMDSASGSTFPVSVSLDGGHTYAYSRNLSSSRTYHDRPWVVATSASSAIVVADGSPAHSWSTSDRGLHWAGPHPLPNTYDYLGKPVQLPSGAVAVPYCFSGRITTGVAVTTDGGLTWKEHDAHKRGSCGNFPTLAVDDAGWLYLAWVSQDSVGAQFDGQESVYLAMSKDGGSTWRDFGVVTPYERNAIMPTLIAGSQGKIDLAYYASDWHYHSSFAPPTATWDVVLMQSLNMGEAAPTFTHTTAVQGFHAGSICEPWVICPRSLDQNGPPPKPGDRSLLDFFSITALQDGSAVIAYPRDHALRGQTDLTSYFPDLYVARQTSGPMIR